MSGEGDWGFQQPSSCFVLCHVGARPRKLLPHVGSRVFNVFSLKATSYISWIKAIMFYLCALSLATLCARAAEHCATPHDGELQSLIQTAAGRTSLDTQELVEAEAQFTHGESDHHDVGGDRMQAARHNYAPIYAKHITELLKTGISTPTIAETGILTGTGLAMWTKLFPKSQVYGFDLNTTSYLSNREKMRELGFKDDRVVVTPMDQMAETAKNQELLRSVLRSPPSIAIDDGYHIPQAGELTFLSFKPFLNEKFVYFIEDVLVQDIDAGRWKPVEASILAACSSCKFIMECPASSDKPECVAVVRSV